MSIIFNPWQGKDYGQSKFGRLLIVGESHYASPAVTDQLLFTQQMIGTLKVQKGNPFYDKISDIFNAEERHDIWDKVAFVNAIQYVFAGSGDKPKREHWLTCEPAVKEYLKQTRPKKMIVFSMGVWNKGLPPRIEWATPVDELKDTGFNRRSNVFRFDYEGGHCHGIGVHHPSSRRPFFRAEEWRPLIGAFLGQNYD